MSHEPGQPAKLFPFYPTTKTHKRQLYHKLWSNEFLLVWRRPKVSFIARWQHSWILCDLHVILSYVLQPGSSWQCSADSDLKVILMAPHGQAVWSLKLSYINIIVGWIGTRWLTRCFSHSASSSSSSLVYSCTLNCSSSSTYSSYLYCSSSRFSSFSSNINPSPSVNAWHLFVLFFTSDHREWYGTRLVVLRNSLCAPLTPWRCSSRQQRARTHIQSERRQRLPHFGPSPSQELLHFPVCIN